MWKVKDNRKSQKRKEFEEYFMAVIVAWAVGIIVSWVMM
jgi:hypothetical protein